MNKIKLKNNSTMEKIEKFIEICIKSRNVGLTIEEHFEKIKMADDLVNDGIMTNNGSYEFVDEKLGEYFLAKTTCKLK